MGMIVSQITSISIVAQPFVQVQIMKENVKTPCDWPLLGDSTSDQ